MNDIRYACRTLRQNAGFALAAIVSIALAIGANSAVFSFVDGILFKPLPVTDPARVVSIRSIAPNTSASSLVEIGMEISYPDFVDFRNKSRSFDGLIAYATESASFARDEHAQAQLKIGYVVTGDFFRVLGVEPSLGRTFRPEEDEVPNRDAVVILGRDFWSEEFSGDSAVIGRHIRLNGVDFTVIGVAPESFTGLNQFVRPAFFVPIMMAPKFDPKENLLTRDYRSVSVKGRLKRSVTLKSAAAEISSEAKSLEEIYPATNKGFDASVRTEIQMRLDRTPAYGAVVVSLFTLVAVVLLIACCNVANLMLGRGRARAREISVRLAIGASRGRLVRQLMIEDLIIALAGGAGGLLITQFAVEYFSNWELVSDIPLKLSFEIDHRVLLFTFLVSIGSAILFGLVPALYCTKRDFSPALKTGEFAEPHKRFFGRNALVVAQIAGSMVLMMAAAGAYRDAASLMEQRGFRTDHLLTIRFDTEVSGYTPKQSEQFQKRLSEEVREIPGVKSVALAYSLPLTAILRQKAVIPEAYSFRPGQTSINVFSNSVDAAYFSAMNVPLLRGRNFQSTDTADTPRVAIVNQAFADKYLGADPVGKRIRLDKETGPWVEVIGVTATGKYVSLVESPTDFLYLPLAQNPEGRLTMIVESSGDPAALAAPVRERIHSLDSNVPILAVGTMDDIFQRTSMQALHFVIGLFATTSLIGCGLALLGLYAVVGYQVSRRTREIGIRMALGAESPQILKMVLRHAARIAAIGVLIGFLLSYVLKDAMGGGGDPTPAPLDPITFLLLPLGMFLTTLLAAAVPARRASRVDPLVALREE